MAVLQALKKGNGVPEDVAGIWTSEDDNRLKKSKRNGQFLQSLENKHGEELIRVRREFLAAMDV